MSTIQQILDDDYQHAITEARARPVGPAIVTWDFTCECWSLECAPCARRLVKRPGDANLSHGQIKESLLTAAAKHNQEKHSA